MVCNQPLVGHAACGRPRVRFGQRWLQTDPDDPAVQLLCQEMRVRVPVRYQVSPPGSGGPGPRDYSGATVLEQRILVTLPLRFGAHDAGAGDAPSEDGDSATAAVGASLELTWYVQVDIPIPGMMSPYCGVAPSYEVDLSGSTLEVQAVFPPLG